MYKGFPKKFPWLISQIVNLPSPKFSKRMIKSGLNNGQSKTGVVNMSNPPPRATVDRAGEGLCYRERNYGSLEASNERT